MSNYPSRTQSFRDLIFRQGQHVFHRSNIDYIIGRDEIMFGYDSAKYQFSMVISNVEKYQFSMVISKDQNCQNFFSSSVKKF